MDTRGFAAPRTPIRGFGQGVLPQIMKIRDEENPPADDKTLYHYTTFDAALGIFHSKTLWASNCLYMNDTQEIAYSVNLLLDVLLFWYNDHERINELYQILSLINSRLPTNIFVFSLTEDPFRLSQWRAYSHPTGMAIGLSTTALNVLCNENSFSLEKVEYDPIKQGELFRPLVEQCIGEVNFERIHNDVTYVDGILKQIVMPFFNRVAPMIKHPSFSEEHEWRLVIDLSKSLHLTERVRSSLGRLTPYVEIPLFPKDFPEGCSQISEVVVGPNTNIPKSLHATNKLLDSEDLNWRSIIHCGIPYESPRP